MKQPLVSCKAIAVSALAISSFMVPEVGARALDLKLPDASVKKWKVKVSATHKHVDATSDPGAAVTRIAHSISYENGDRFDEIVSDSSAKDHAGSAKGKGAKGAKGEDDVEQHGAYKHRNPTDIDSVSHPAPANAPGKNSWNPNPGNLPEGYPVASSGDVTEKWKITSGSDSTVATGRGGSVVGSSEGVAMKGLKDARKIWDRLFGNKNKNNAVVVGVAPETVNLAEKSNPDDMIAVTRTFGSQTTKTLPGGTSESTSGSETYHGPLNGTGFPGYGAPPVGNGNSLDHDIQQTKDELEKLKNGSGLGNLTLPVNATDYEEDGASGNATERR